MMLFGRLGVGFAGSFSDAFFVFHRMLSLSSAIRLDDLRRFGSVLWFIRLPDVLVLFFHGQRFMCAANARPKPCRWIITVIRGTLEGMRCLSV